MAHNVPPDPTFSPSRDHGSEMPDERFECEIVPAAAMCAAQLCAFALRFPFVARGGSPLPARSEFVAETRSQSAWAGVVGSTTSEVAPTTASSTKRRITSPPPPVHRPALL
jgi:hypothetical protein